MRDRRGVEGVRPHLWFLLLTLIPACFLWIELGRAVTYRLQFPAFSLREPMRLLFLYGEHHRLERGRDAGDPATACTEGRRAFEELAEEGKRLLAWAPRAGGARVKRVLADKEAMTVLGAGCGNAEARQRLDGAGFGELPEYTLRRAREISEGSSERDAQRAKAVRRFELARKWMSYALLVLGAVALLVLVREWRRRPTHGDAGVRRLDWAAAVVVFIWAEAGLRLWWHLRPEGFGSLSDLLKPISSTVQVFLVLLLARSVWGRGPRSPVTRMLRPPANRRRRRLAFAWTLGALAAFAVCDVSVQFLAPRLGLHTPWCAFMMEPVLVGTPWQATVASLESIVASPVAEELLFRGLLFGGFAPLLGVSWAALLSGLIFAAVHGAAPLDSLRIAVHGYVYARLYARTGSLWPSVFLHSLANVQVWFANVGYLL